MLLPLPEEPAAAARRRDLSLLAGLGLLALLATAGLSRYELLARAKRACLEGEAHLRWIRNPAARRAALQARVARGALNPAQAALLLGQPEVVAAWRCFGTAADLFQPPASEWSRRSERGLAELRPLYEAWRRSRGLMPLPPD